MDTFEMEHMETTSTHAIPNAPNHPYYPIPPTTPTHFVLFNTIKDSLFIGYFIPE